MDGFIKPIILIITPAEVRILTISKPIQTKELNQLNKK
jgi:hypothetical protein